MHCRTAQAWMVAGRDGELGGRRQRALDRHLAACAACRAEAASLGDVLAALDRLPQAIDVPARLEHAIMRRVRAAADDEGRGWVPVALAWTQRLAPAVAATAVVVLAAVGVRGIDAVAPRPQVAARRPEVARPVAPAPPQTVARRPKVQPPDDPPPALASRPELFVDLPILRDLDKLKHFDSIAAMDDGDAGAPSGDGGASNG